MKPQWLNFIYSDNVPANLPKHVFCVENIFGMNVSTILEPWDSALPFILSLSQEQGKMFFILINLAVIAVCIRRTFEFYRPNALKCSSNTTRNQGLESLPYSISLIEHRRTATLITH